MYNNLGSITVDNLYKFHLFKFLNLVLNGNLPHLYNLLLRPLLSTHNYRTSGGRFRHPLVTCEIERRAVAYQLVLLYDEIDPDFCSSLEIHRVFKKYKRFLLGEQQR